jgi:nitrate/TMAO reductase-like tetraheme cytochrome c subunit
MKLFKKKTDIPAVEVGEKKGRNWFKISLIANAVLVVGVIIAISAKAIIYQSDTNPQLCNVCHIMRPNVQSYLTSNHLDNAHEQAGVECKECHDYPVSAEVRSGINYLIGNYYIDQETGEIPKREFGNEICTQCHISMEHVAIQTDYLVRNPHMNHETNLQCSDCHVSHGAQINYCIKCHDDGGQRMIEEEVIPRADNPYWSIPAGTTGTSNPITPVPTP